jgi:hypothetical protein
LANPTLFAGQNWLITPAAAAVNAAPSTIDDQVWILVLSGVAHVDLKGQDPDQWSAETLTILPDTASPMQYAVDRYGVPQPSPVPGGYRLAFSLDEWAPLVALGAIFDQGGSEILGSSVSVGLLDSPGFAVDVWRPTHFDSGTDLNGRLVERIFAGVDVDVSVRDPSAWVLRVSYNFTLLGRIRFMAAGIF